ncbi:HAD family hydrolase [Staphylococcus lutrae]|uniref:Hydrolase n=1 Tax=Staphylococcus lutrae TaxID=155085 RepID=A0AAC9WJB5_9STAP|nr:HAD family hydrolase [Staphylococcus lutrae]ARJ51104.1 hydrolase [Staphylococcus lutrae]PNZ39568.1 HAD family hydrolase [Staphylococcus lutrae]
MAQLKWILFDKDGTLIHFDESWVKIGIQLVNDVCAHFNIKDVASVYRAIGVNGNQFVKGSVMERGTLAEMIDVFQQFTQQDVSQWVSQQSQKLMRQRVPEIELYPGVQTLLERLKVQSYRLGLVTSDNATGMTQFIEQTGLEGYFDLLISTNEGQYEKPDIRLLNPLWEQGISGKQVVMVGDTDIDMRTGKNMGSALNVGVRTGLGRDATFDAADAVIDHVGLLEDVLTEMTSE